jgi:hypothetical protein
MAQADRYQLLMDWDRDGFYCQDVALTDPLNQLPNPVSWHGLFYVPATALSTAELRREDSAYGVYVLRIDSGGDALGGVVIGEHEGGVLYSIPCRRLFDYTVTFWVRKSGITDDSTVFEVSVLDDADTLLNTPVTFAFGNDFAQVTTSFTTLITSTYLKISILKPSGDTMQSTLDIAGLMLVEGTEAPAVFNAGDISNARDDIFPYCESVQAAYGIPQYAEVMAPPSSMTAVLTNIEGEFSPENPPVGWGAGAVNLTAPGIQTEAYVGQELQGDDGTYADGVNNIIPPSISTTAIAGVEIQGDDGAWLREGFFSKGLLAKLLATHTVDGIETDFPLYIGTLATVQVDAGMVGGRRTVLTFGDVMTALNRAEYRPPLQEDVTIDEVIEVPFEDGVVAYPYPADFWLLDVEGASELDISTVLFENRLTDFETGDTTLAFAGDVTGGGQMAHAAEFIRENVTAELGGRFFWDARDGLLRFFNRTHDIRQTALAEAPGVIELDEPAVYVWGDDVLNYVVVTYYPRVIGAANSTLYSLGNAPLTLSAGQNRQMTVRYQVTDALHAAVAGKDMQTPVPTLDYTATANADGTGGDLTTTLQTVVTFNATSADITLINGGGVALYLQTFNLRGTPLTSYQPAQVTAMDSLSIVAQGEQKRALDIPALGDIDLAQAYAESLTQRYANPVGRIASATLWANRDEATLVALLPLAVGEHVLLYDPFVNNIAREYVVTALAHTLTPAKTHRVRLTVEPLDRYLYWILDDDVLSILDETTRIGL